MKLFYKLIFFILFINFSYAQCNDKILFIVDDSGSISNSERQDMQVSIQQLSDDLFIENPMSEIGLVQYGQPDSSANSQPSYYITYPFSINPTIILQDDPGGLFLIQDVLPNSIDSMINDGLFSAGGQFEDTTSIFIFTDAALDASCFSVLENCTSCPVVTQACGYDYLLDLSVSLGNIPISVFRVLPFFGSDTADGIQQNGGVLIEDVNFQITTQQIDDLTQSLACIDANYTFTNTCFGDTTQFTLTSDDPITSVLWDFGDSTTSTDVNPTHVFSNIGTYTITLTITSSTETVTFTNTITIFETPVANTIPDYILCDDASNDETETFDLTTRDQFILGSQSATDFAVNYFFSLNDADTNTSPLNTNYNNVVNNQEIFARIQNSGNANCYSVTSFLLIVDAQPVANPIANYIICDDDSNDGVETFDIASLDSQILNGQSTTDFNISYHLTSNDAINDLNPLPATYTTLSNNVVVYVKLFNISNPDCFDIIEFSLITSQKPIANPVDDYVKCENDLLPTNLNQFNNQVLGTQNSSDFTVTYYTSQADAISGLNPIVTGFDFDQPTVLYIKIENNIDANCYDTTTLNLDVFEFPFLDSEEIENCYENNFTLDADIEVNGATYLWNTGETTSSIVVNNFGTYTVEITIDNCSKTKDIEFVQKINCFIPQGISPNNDNINDYFDVSFLDIDNIIIYNRYGVEVYAKPNYIKEWNGTSNNGDELPTGTYFYVIKTKTDDTLTGWVYLAR